MADKDKLKALKLAVGQIRSSRARAHHAAGQDEVPANIAAIRRALWGRRGRIGGVPRGRIIEVYGPSRRARHPGLNIIAQPRRRRQRPHHAEQPSSGLCRNSVSDRRLLISQPDTASRRLSHRDAGPSGASTSSSWTPWLPHAARRDRGRDGDPTGPPGSAHDQALRKLTAPSASQHPRRLHHQIRMKIGVMFATPRRPRRQRPQVLPLRSGSTSGSLGHQGG